MSNPTDRSVHYAHTTDRSLHYGRVSYWDREGDNLDSQLEMDRGHSQKHGYRCVAELTEDTRGASGVDMDLPALNEALEMARAGQFDVLVVREMDRLARSLAKQLVIEMEFQKVGVRIEYVLGEYPDTPEGQLLKNVRAVVAEYERLKTRERTARARRRRVRQGSVSVSGQPPFGYREVVNDGRRGFEIDEEEAAVVRDIYQWYISGDETTPPLSIEGITRRLSRMRVPTFTERRERQIRSKRLGYGQWGRGVVHSILRNETYAGRWSFGKRLKRDGRIIPSDPNKLLFVEVPAIITRETWRAAQRRLVQNRERWRGRRPTHPYLFSKRVQCGACGRRMSGHTKRSGDKLYHYYHCSSRYAATGVRCEMPLFRSDHVDRGAWERIKSFLLNRDQLMERWQHRRENQDEYNEQIGQRIADVEAELGRLDIELNRLIMLYVAGDYGKDMLDRHRDRLDGARAELENQREELLAQLERSFSADDEAALSAFVDQIAAGLTVADSDFDKRRWIIEKLDIEATLWIKEGKKAIKLSCGLDGDIFPDIVFYLLA